MRFSFNLLIFSLFFVSIASAQDLTREQKLQKIDELNSQIKVLERDVLLPDAKDLKQAEKVGFEVFRLMPRERYDGKLTVQGGGAFYSFTTKSHDYQKIPQIELTGKNLSVGFAGADYGFIADLENIPLEEINKETKGVNFLLNYQPPNIEPLARSEFIKFIKGYEIEGVNYNRRVSVIIGHSYVLRAITYNNGQNVADISVAFNIIRKDTDGSLIIFWKLLENFEKPILIRNEQSYSANTVNFVSVKVFSDSNSYFSGNSAAGIQEELRKKGFNEVKVKEEGKMIVLRGTVPKGKLAEVIQLAVNANGGKPIKNQLTEK